nr:hypothetical protein BaRGS_028659 [Batillaria attramentaria]
MTTYITIMKVLIFVLIALVFADAKLKHKANRKRAVCGDLEFQCSNGQCIEQEWLCDTENDCGNNEDEIGCPVCGDIDFQCSNGQCIQQEWLCDTENDCGNNEDEIGCPAGCTGEHVTKCNNGQCIPVEFRCDGDNDCGDGTDENGCDVYQCPTGEVKCPTTQLCIEKDWLCDMDDDCGDGWDENAMNCHPNGP